MALPPVFEGFAVSLSKLIGLLLGRLQRCGSLTGQNDRGKRAAFTGQDMATQVGEGATLSNEIVYKE